MVGSNQTVRWGVMGTARIATKVSAAIWTAVDSELAAIASRSQQRAEDWAKEHKASRAYSSYEELLDDTEIDAVYIPLPPSLHREWTIKAAEHGKHVLCEKPLAMNAAETEEMWAACRQHGVQLMDGVMWLHHPRAADMHGVLSKGELGTLRHVTSAFTFNWDVVPEDDLRLQRELGGGSLLDLGWYCVGATLWAYGDVPKRVYGTGRYYRDVDMHFTAIMWFDDDRMASFNCGFDTQMRKWLEVAGTKASLICDDFTRPWNDGKSRFWIHDQTGKADERQSPGPLIEVSMIEDFNRIVRDGRLNEHWSQVAIKTQRVCDALDQSARSGSVVELTS